MKLVINSLLLILLVGCASGIKIESRRCQSKGAWVDDNQKLDKRIEISMRGFGIHEVNLNDEFTDQKVKCSEVKRMRMTMEQDFFDVVFSLLPGYSSQTLILEYSRN
jgi:hypothetical protein